ncbi:MAG: hypothetical protein ABII01_05990 [Candidatus Woesearchaeota archaeon]
MKPLKMVYISMYRDKKGLLITIMSLLLILPIFYLTDVYFDRNRDLQTMIVVTGLGDKIRYTEDDIISNAYSDLLGIHLNDINRDSNINVSFNQVLLDSGRDYSTYMDEYKDFATGTYASLNNLNISLDGFNHNFTIRPYNTTIEVLGEDIAAYTMPVSPNHVEGITIAVRVLVDNDSSCLVPNDDANGFPSVKVTYVHNLGSCTQTVQLNPQENNDASGNQFYLDTANPTGSIEVKYGQITSKIGDGILEILTSGISSNVTQLDIEYTLTNERISLTGGNITIKSAISNVTRTSAILLAEE